MVLEDVGGIRSLWQMCGELGSGEKCRWVGAMTVDQGGKSRVTAWLLGGGLSERPI